MILKTNTQTKLTKAHNPYFNNSRRNGFWLH